LGVYDGAILMGSRKNPYSWLLHLNDSMNTTKVVGTRGVSQCGLAIHIKRYLKAKEEL